MKKKTKKDGPCPECGNMSEADWEKCAEKFGKDMECWGENFGKHMEAKFSKGQPWHKHKKSLSVGGLVFSLLILSWGVAWLGNDLGWWQFDFPFWPVLVVIIGLAALINTIKESI
jgi:hypothetical protein